MSSILDNYKKQLEEDKTNFNEEELLDTVGSETVKAVQELKNDPNDMENIYKAFQKEFPKMAETEFDEKGNTFTDRGATIYIKHVYCPNCGKELISKSPIMYNPFTLEKVAKHECSCGFKANLEHAYPRIMFIDQNGEEIKAFTD